MLTPILATDDPYQAVKAFVSAGWSLAFQTPPDSGDPLACVALAGSQVMLGTSLPQFLPADSRAHKGAELSSTSPCPARTWKASTKRTAGTLTRSPAVGPG